jgi:hypothetical protein
MKNYIWTPFASSALQAVRRQCLRRQTACHHERFAGGVRQRAGATPPEAGLRFLNMHPLNKPEVMVTFAQDKTDKSGKVTDEKTREIISQLLTNLLA